MANSVQCYLTTTYTRRVYSRAGAQVTPLSARTFGTWTFVSALVRLAAAFDATSRPLYLLAFATYAIAFAHFASELLLYRTTSWGSGLMGPAVVSTSSMVWMLWQWDAYIG